MIKLMEEKLNLTVVGEDKELVKGILNECEKEYAERMKKETEKNFNCSLAIDNSKNLKRQDDCGGATLVSADGRIVCVNTISSKLKLVYEQLLPDIRKILFPFRK
jgi:V-type H+-transporting ATPase subunit E